MVWKKLYFRTKNKKEYFKAVLKESNNKIKPESLVRYYRMNKQKYGTQEELRKQYKRKYEYEYNYTDNMNSFINECKRRYRGSNIKSLKRRYYDIRERMAEKEYKKTEKIIIEIEKKDIVEKKIEEKISINETSEPSILKMMQIYDMKRMRYKITDMMLKQYGYNRFEINWLRLNKVI